MKKIKDKITRDAQGDRTQHVEFDAREEFAQGKLPAYSLTALSYEAVSGEVISIQGKRALIICKIPVDTVIREAQPFFDQVMQGLPAGVTVHWYQVQMIQAPKDTARKV